MSGKVQERHEKLRSRLIDAAQARIEEGGLHSVKARDLAKQAECAVGAIYNVFEDINALVMAVNGRTFHALGAAVSAAMAADDRENPNQRLITMSNAYLAFAAEHTNLWRALFDLQMTAEGGVPQWYLDELDQLFAIIENPLEQLFPQMGAEELNLMVRALFSSVHGIVLLGLENRISAVPRDRIEKMISQLLLQIGNK